ncbi:hypothetical protein PtB15_6B367 [Puccinia triticina]|nr:hypothetical protein PtB15_6B367 [Puccinia triticina]
MWLPHFLLVFVFVSQLTIDTDCKKPVSLIWLPSKFEGNFLDDVDKFQDDQPVISSASGYIRIPMDPDRAEIAYFQTRFKNLGKMANSVNRNEQRLNLVNQAVHHLLYQTYMSREHLKEWCKALTKTMENHRPYQDIHIEILHALHTLRLQNYEDQDLTQEISEMMKPTMSELSRQSSWASGVYSRIRFMSKSSRQPIETPPWASELLRPNEGLSANFRIWGEANLVNDEPRLSDFAAMIDIDYRNHVRYFLGKVLDEIFSRPPPKNVSSQTRIVAITLLFHLLNVNGKYNNLPVILVNSLISSSNQERYFLFDHEIALLNKLLCDHRTLELSKVKTSK